MNDDKLCEECREEIPDSLYKQGVTRCYNCLYREMNAEADSQ
jgi:hypothetical protein